MSLESNARHTMSWLVYLKLWVTWNICLAWNVGPTQRIGQYLIFGAAHCQITFKTESSPVRNRKKCWVVVGYQVSARHCGHQHRLSDQLYCLSWPPLLIWPSSLSIQSTNYLAFRSAFWKTITLTGKTTGSVSSVRQRFREDIDPWSAFCDRVPMSPTYLATLILI